MTDIRNLNLKATKCLNLDFGALGSCLVDLIQKLALGLPNKCSLEGLPTNCWPEGLLTTADFESFPTTCWLWRPFNPLLTLKTLQPTKVSQGHIYHMIQCLLELDSHSTVLQSVQWCFPFTLQSVFNSKISVDLENLIAIL